MKTIERMFTSYCVFILVAMVSAQDSEKKQTQTHGDQQIIVRCSPLILSLAGNVSGSAGTSRPASITPLSAADIL